MNFEVNARDLDGAGVDGTRVLAPVLVPDLSDVQVPVAHISVFDGNSGIVNEPPLIFTYQYFLWIHPYHLKINEEKMYIAILNWNLVIFLLFCRI